MANKEKKLGYGAAWKLNLRAWGIWQKLCPQVFVSLLLSSVVKAVTPYVTIFLSARIIDELSGERRPDQLLRWVVLTLACTAACAIPWQSRRQTQTAMPQPRQGKAAPSLQAARRRRCSQTGRIRRAVAS